MPIYEFECRQCGEQFEELVRTEAEAKILTCPHCSGKRVVKLFSAFGFKSGSKVVSSVQRSSASCQTCAAKTCDTCL